MYTKKLLGVLILGLTGFSGSLWAEECPQPSYTLTTMNELKLFEQIGCSRVSGLLRIGGGSGSPLQATGDITHVDSLINLVEVGALDILYNSSLTSLRGLSNLQSVGSFQIDMNRSLESLAGLENISEWGCKVQVTANPKLANCSAIASAPWDSITSAASGEQPPFSPAPPNYSPEVCEGVSIQNNAPGCNSLEEILQSVDTSPSPPVPALQLILETPAEGDTYSGISTLRGWAVAEEGISKVDIYIDGNFFQSAPYGGKRGDVGSIFPEINDSDESGFALAYNFSGLSAGTHTIKVEAVTTQGRVLSRTSQFQVTKFPAQFLPADQSPDLRGASCVINDQTVHILDTLVDGSVYNVSLEWRTADQGFQIQEIR